jgi:UDP-N-acetylmuramoylalanine-D-glutamate ligase
MQEAVEFAFKNTKNWEICLLSTASPSYSIWKNFEEKWDEFRKNVYKINQLFHPL